jgi:integrase
MPTSRLKGRLEDFKKKSVGFRYNARSREAIFDLRRNGTRHRKLYEATGEGLDAYRDAEKAFMAFRDAVESEAVPTPALTKKTPLRASERPLLKDYMESEWELLTVGVKESTERDYRYATTLLNPVLGELPIDSITSAHLKQYLVAHKDRSASTRNNGIAFLKKVLRHAEEAGHIPHEALPRKFPLERIPVLHLELTVEEQAAFLNAFDDEQAFRQRIQTKRKSSGKSAVSTRYLSERPFGAGMRADSEAASVYFDRYSQSKLFFVAALDTGIRLTDLRLLRKSSVRLDYGLIKFVTGKTQRETVIALSERCHAALSEAMSASSSEYVFTSDGVQPYPEASIRRYFKIAKAAAGIDRRFRIHDLRHSFATNLTSAGVPLSVVASGLGHSSTRMSERYVGISPEALNMMRAALNTAAKRSDSVSSDRNLNDVLDLGL